MKGISNVFLTVIIYGTADCFGQCLPQQFRCSDGSCLDSQLICGDGDFKCPAGVVLGFFPHASDCPKYNICIYGTAFEMDCEMGLDFNRSTLICEDPKTAGCR